jgi:hypothetical protein
MEDVNLPEMSVKLNQTLLVAFLFGLVAAFLNI